MTYDWKWTLNIHVVFVNFRLILCSTKPFFFSIKSEHCDAQRPPVLIYDTFAYFVIVLPTPVGRMTIREGVNGVKAKFYLCTVLLASCFDSWCELAQCTYVFHSWLDVPKNGYGCGSKEKHGAPPGNWTQGSPSPYGVSLLPEARIGPDWSHVFCIWT